MADGALKGGGRLGGAVGEVAEGVEREVYERDVDGLGEFAAADEVEGGGDGVPGTFDGFTGVELGRGGDGGVFGEVEVHAVCLAGGIGERRGEVAPAGGGGAGLLAQFALAAGEKVFAGVDHAAGKLPRERTGAVAVLADEEQVKAP